MLEGTVFRGREIKKYFGAGAGAGWEDGMKRTLVAIDFKLELRDAIK